MSRTMNSPKLDMEPSLGFQHWTLDLEFDFNRSSPGFFFRILLLGTRSSSALSATRRSSIPRTFHYLSYRLFLSYRGVEVYEYIQYNIERGSVTSAKMKLEARKAEPEASL